MVIHIELAPAEEAALIARAQLCGRDPSDHVHQLIRDDLASADQVRDEAVANRRKPTPEDLLDHEFIAQCAKVDSREVPSVDEVRRALAKIPGALSEEIIADRGDAA